MNKRARTSLILAVATMAALIGGPAMPSEAAGPSLTTSAAVTAAASASAFAIRPGAATDVAVGANGSVWVLGTSPVGGGFPPFSWRGGGWRQAPGGAVDIAVDRSGNPWVVNSFHHIYHWNGRAWAMLPGAATAAGVGANGPAWVLGTRRVPGGYPIYFWTGGRWQQLVGAAVQLAVDRSGNPWVVNSFHHIYHWNGRAWSMLPGAATDVGAGANGSVWVVGTSGLSGGFPIFAWTGSRWAQVAGAAIDIAVDPNGNPWVVNSSHQVFSYAPSVVSHLCTNPVYHSSANSFNWYAPGEHTTYVNNDTWNTAEAGPQTMYICTLSSFYVLSNQPNLASDQGSVKSYPSVCDCSMPNQPMSAYSILTATFGEANTHVGEWDASFDNYTNQNEIMIQNDQNNHGNGVQQGGIPVNIDGVDYHVTAGGHGFICFVADSNHQTGTINFLKFYTWIVKEGWDTWADTLNTFAYGTEISWTRSPAGAPGQQRFDVTNFSLTTKNK